MNTVSAAPMGDLEVEKIIETLAKATPRQLEEIMDLLMERAPHSYAARRIAELEEEVEILKEELAAAKAPKPAKAAAVITSVKLVQDPDWVGIKPPTKALGGDLAKILEEGEEVRVCFGARKEKKEYIGIYSAGGINGHGSPSLFAKVSAWTHYGTTDHKTEYNGWAKCEVQRDGAWVTLKSLRD